MLEYITNFFTRLLEYSGDFFVNWPTVLFYANYIFFLIVRVHMKLENNASE